MLGVDVIGEIFEINILVRLYSLRLIPSVESSAYRRRKNAKSRPKCRKLQSDPRKEKGWRKVKDLRNLFSIRTANDQAIATRTKTSTVTTISRAYTKAGCATAKETAPTGPTSCQNGVTTLHAGRINSNAGIIVIVYQVNLITRTFNQIPFFCNSTNTTSRVVQCATTYTRHRDLEEKIRKEGESFCHSWPEAFIVFVNGAFNVYIRN